MLYEKLQAFLHQLPKDLVKIILNYYKATSLFLHDKKNSPRFWYITPHDVAPEWKQIGEKKKNFYGDLTYLMQDDKIVTICNGFRYEDVTLNLETGEYNIVANDEPPDILTDSFGKHTLHGHIQKRFDIDSFSTKVIAYNTKTREWNQVSPLRENQVPNLGPILFFENVLYDIGMEANFSAQVTFCSNGDITTTEWQRFPSHSFYSGNAAVILDKDGYFGGLNSGILIFGSVYIEHYDFRQKKWSILSNWKLPMGMDLSFGKQFVAHVFDGLLILGYDSTLIYCTEMDTPIPNWRRLPPLYSPDTLAPVLLQDSITTVL